MISASFYVMKPRLITMFFKHLTDIIKLIWRKGMLINGIFVD